jgi:L-rhamnose mutarotase
MERKSTKLKRYGQVIRLRPEAREDYVRYHAKVWPEVLTTIHDCNIRNYSIFLKDNTLFAYFECFGEDFQADMQKMAADPKTQKMVGHHEAHAAARAETRGRRMVGRYGRGVPRRVNLLTLCPA